MKNYKNERDNVYGERIKTSKGVEYVVNTVKQLYDNGSFNLLKDADVTYKIVHSHGNRSAAIHYDYYGTMNDF